MSYWHTMCAGGADPFGTVTMDRSYGVEGDPMKQAFAKADAAFEFMQKLSIDYFCFHDIDIAPEGRVMPKRRTICSKLSNISAQKWTKPASNCSGVRQIALAILGICTVREHPAVRMLLPMPQRRSKCHRCDDPSGRQRICLLGRTRGLRDPAEYQYGSGTG